MSVFKKYRGKRVRPNDPDWSLGQWYVWKRVAGVIVHRALKGVQSAEEAIAAEAQLVRGIARRADQKYAGQIAKAISSLPTNGKPANGYLYLLESNGYYKIGQTANLVTRLKQISKTIIPFHTKLVLAVEIEGGARDCEAYYHQKYAAFRVTGEWFDLTRDQIAELKRDILDYSSIP